MAGPRAATEAALTALHEALVGSGGVSAETLRNAAVRLSGVLMSGRAEAVAVATEGHGLELLVAAARALPGHAEVQRWALGALGTAAELGGESAATAALGVGAMSAVVDGLRGHPGSVEVQRWGLSALRALLEGGGSRAVKSFGAAGGGEVLVRGLLQHRASGMVQAAGLGALGCVVLESDGEASPEEVAARLPLLGAPGVRLAVAALTVHVGDCEVERRALAALWALLEADSDAAAEAVLVLLSDGGSMVDAVLTATRGHGADGGAGGEAQRWGVAVLGALARAGGSPVVSTLAAHGAVEAVAGAMRRDLADAEVQERGIGVLMVLAADGSKDEVQLLIDEGGLEAVQAAVAAHPEHRQVQTWGEAVTELILEGHPTQADVEAAEVSDDGTASAGSDDLLDIGEAEAQESTCSGTASPSGPGPSGALSDMDVIDM